MAAFWYQVFCTVLQPQIDIVCDALESLGALSISMQDGSDEPIYEPDPDEIPLWQVIHLKVLFADDVAIQAIVQTLCQQFENIAFHYDKLPEQAWSHTWKQDFKPTLYGNRLWLCPSWITPPEPNAVNVILDPGLAFGTGHHPTTALCLDWLAENISATDTVIDYGCGSGILAISALKLGCQQVWAIDHDPQALIATKENAIRNNINLEQLSIMHPEQIKAIKARILIANILTNPLLELAHQFAEYVEHGGLIVISGVLTSQIDLIVDKYRSWFTLRTPITRSDWVRFDGIRKKP